MKRRILPYVEEMIRGLNDCGQPRVFPKYSLEWVTASLDEKRLEGKYGKEWKGQPPDIRDYYRAEGYLHAVHQMAEKQAQKENAISCDLKEMLSQEIAFELEEKIQKAFCQAVLKVEQ